MKKLAPLLVLDFGSYYIKLVEALLADPLPLIKKCSLIPLPVELRKIDSIKNPAYVKFVQKIIHQENISAKQTVVCLSEPQLEIYHITLPAMGTKELESSLQWQLKDLLSFPVNNAVYDYLITSNKKTVAESKVAISVAAISQQITANYLSLLASLGLNPIAFYIEPELSWQVIKRMPELENKKAVTLVNLGAEKSHITIFENNILKLTRSLPWAGNKFTEHIISRIETVNNTALTPDQAEEIKGKYGISIAGDKTFGQISSPDIFAALRPVLENMVSELSHIQEYYQSDLGGKKTEIIVLYGGSANLPGFSDYLSKNMEIPVILPQPVSLNLVRIGNSAKEIYAQKGSFFIPAIGALLNHSKKINLLPPEIKEKKKFLKEKKLWFKIWSALLAFLAASYLLLGISAGIKKITLNKLKKQSQQYSSLKSGVEDYYEKVSTLNQKMALCRQLLSPEPFWADILKELAGLVPARIVFKEISMNKEKENQQEKGPACLKINGIVNQKISLPQEEITKFLHNLEKSPYFYAVKLDFSRETPEKDQGLEFGISCKIAVTNSRPAD